MHQYGALLGGGGGGQLALVTSVNTQVDVIRPVLCASHDRACGPPRDFVFLLVHT